MPTTLLELMNAERYLNGLWRVLDQAKQRIDQIDLKWVSITL